jgi:hypothetical protein
LRGLFPFGSGKPELDPRIAVQSANCRHQQQMMARGLWSSRCGRLVVATTSPRNVATPVTFRPTAPAQSLHRQLAPKSARLVRADHRGGLRAPLPRVFR